MAAQDVAVCRVDYDPVPALLPSGCGAFVAALLADDIFGDAFDEAAATAPGFDLTPILALLLANGAITAIGEPT